MENSSNSTVGRKPAHNIFAGPSGVLRQVSKSITSAYDAWKQFIHEVILRSIVKYTTEEGHRKGDTNFSLSLNEIEAFIALQYVRGLFGKNLLVSFFYNKEYRIPIFPETTPRDRFIKILKYQRFDDKLNRRTGSDRDQFPPIRDVFVKFASMSQTKYKCNFSLTVDEQLMPVKSRCPFVTFMPNKPDKMELNIGYWQTLKRSTVCCKHFTVFGSSRTRRKRRKFVGGICIDPTHAKCERKRL